MVPDRQLNHGLGTQVCDLTLEFRVKYDITLPQGSTTPNASIGHMSELCQNCIVGM